MFRVSQRRATAAAQVAADRVRDQPGHRRHQRCRRAGSARFGRRQGAANFTSDLGFAVPAVCVGMAILRYRLYDIDRIISRTLAYAIVTGLLIGLYAGLVLLATRVLSFHVPVAVAASTLAAAALFNPLRRWVQQLVDPAVQPGPV